MEVTQFEDIQTEFMNRAQQAVYCNVASVDLKGRPRSRVMHVIWEGPTGWVITWPESHKAKHLANNPYVSLAYVNNPMKPVYIECAADWITGTADQQRIWELHQTIPPPLGFDPTPHYGTIEHPYFGVLRFTPWRIELAELGAESLIWRPGVGSTHHDGQLAWRHQPNPPSRTRADAPEMGPFQGEVMERKMRRTDRALPESEARTILEQGEYGILSTVSSDGQPYGVPVSYSYTGDVIYFHCAIEGHKLDNLSGNSKVSFCVVGKTQVLPDKFATNYESVIVFGTAFEVIDDEKHTGLVELLQKYSPGFVDKGLRYIEGDGHKARVYKIVIETMTGKARKK